MFRLNQPTCHCFRGSFSPQSPFGYFRPKGETPEQRRLRKQAIKEARRFRRQEKKGNKVAFAEEQRKVLEFPLYRSV